MKAIKCFAALLAIGGIVAAILGAGAADKSLPLGAGMMIGGVTVLAIAVGIIELVEGELMFREAVQKIRDREASEGEKGG